MRWSTPDRWSRRCCASVPPPPWYPRYSIPSSPPPAPTSFPDDMCFALSGDEYACLNGRFFSCHALAPLWTITTGALNSVQSDLGCIALTRKRSHHQTGPCICHQDKPSSDGDSRSQICTAQSLFTCYSVEITQVGFDCLSIPIQTVLTWA